MTSVSGYVTPFQEIWREEHCILPRGGWLGGQGQQERQSAQGAAAPRPEWEAQVTPAALCPAGTASRGT